MKHRMPIMCLIAAAVVAATVTSIGAHHSASGVYALDKNVTIEGEIAQVVVRSPHSFVHVNATNDKRERVRWVLEWGSVAQLSRNGVDAKTLHVGDHVVVGGHPGRNPADHRMVLAFIERPKDGWSWGRRPGETID
jgi:hypothetical protein